MDDVVVPVTAWLSFMQVMSNLAGPDQVSQEELAIGNSLLPGSRLPVAASGAVDAYGAERFLEDVVEATVGILGDEHPRLLLVHDPTKSLPTPNPHRPSVRYPGTCRRRRAGETGLWARRRRSNRPGNLSGTGTARSRRLWRAGSRGPAEGESRLWRR